MSPSNSNQKILLKVSGSIAAYKAAILCSRLIQKGYIVKVVCSDHALKFIGKMTFEGLTNSPVSTNIFEHGKAMDHIHLIRWADIVLLYPATANTINKLAIGIGDDLLSTLFLAHDFQKPYLLAPAMNGKMYSHPATQTSLKKLINMGINVLPTEKGNLACGENDYGRALCPDKIISIIEKYSGGIQKIKTPMEKKKIIISSGGTRENIDGVRFISNMSTGKTGVSIAETLTSKGHSITFLQAEGSLPPKNCENTHLFSSAHDLEKKMHALLQSQSFDIIIHLAAVSDYSVQKIKVNDQALTPDSSIKIPSNANELIIHMKKNPKLIDKLKGFSKNPNIKIIGFKLTKTNDENEKKMKISQLFSHSSCDLVVHNDLLDREKNTPYFRIFNSQMVNLFLCQTPEDLAIQLIQEVIHTTKENLHDSHP